MFGPSLLQYLDLLTGIAYYSSLYLTILGWFSCSAFTHLKGFPITPLYRVLHLIAGVETWEGGEGVDPGAA